MRTKIAPFLFGCAGLVLLAFCHGWIGGRLALLENGARTEGVVISLDRSRGSSRANHPVVRFYTAAGREVVFHGSIGSNPPAYRIGEEVSVVYLPDRPDVAEIDNFLELWLLTLIVGLLGLVFSGLGFGAVAWQIRRDRLGAWLRRHGREVQAKVIGVTQPGRGRGRRRLRWHISAQWLDPAGGDVHLFKSPTLRFDPEPFLEDETITVTLDPDDPKRYAMDLSSLPRMAN